MAEHVGLGTGDNIEVIDQKHPRLGKTGIVVSTDSRQGRNLTTGVRFEELQVHVRMDDTGSLETFTNLTKSIASQIKKL